MGLAPREMMNTGDGGGKDSRSDIVRATEGLMGNHARPALRRNCGCLFGAGSQRQMPARRDASGANKGMEQAGPVVPAAPWMAAGAARQHAGHVDGTITRLGSEWVFVA